MNSNEHSLNNRGIGTMVILVFLVGLAVGFVFGSFNEQDRFLDKAYVESCYGGDRCIIRGYPTSGLQEIPCNQEISCYTTEN